LAQPVALAATDKQQNRSIHPPTIASRALTASFATLRLSTVGGKHAPATVVVPEEEQAPRTRRKSRFDPHVASATRACAAEFSHANGNRRPRREPLFDEEAQGLLTGGSHDPLHMRSSCAMSRVSSALSEADDSSASSSASSMARLVAAALNVLQWAECLMSERRRTSCRAVLRFIAPPALHK
jgi:hypothetical protein